MLIFKKRRNRPVGASIASNCTYWDVQERSKKIGWFGVFMMEDKQYTDIEVLFKYRGKGHFKQIYDHYLENLWDGERLLAFVGFDNRASIKAHNKYGCRVIKKNLNTWIYLVQDKRRQRNGRV